MKIIDVRNKNEKELNQILFSAVKAIQKGELVIFPTETVYGLGADCFNPSAVNKIFLVKNRPYTDPLIVHISKISQLKFVVSEISEKAKMLIKTFWPGPLSLVLKKNLLVPDIVTAGLDTVCVRMPENKIAQKFISLCKTPIAAPSANIFSRVSSTDIDHILKDFNDSEEIKFVIYSGRTKYGLESTILDCTGYPFKLLRYGAIEVEKIKTKLGIKIFEPKLQSTISSRKSKLSPGMFKKHYSPNTPTYVTDDVVKYISKLKHKEIFNKVFICSDKVKNQISKIYGDKILVLHYGQKIQDIAKNLYLCLRLADDMKPKEIIIESVTNVGLGKTIMDRIIKSSENRWV